MEALRAVPGVRQILIGPPAEITWPGPDTSFDLGVTVTFGSMDAVRAYIPHPLHQAAIKVSVELSRRVHGFYFEVVS